MHCVYQYIVDATSEVGEATCKVFARYSATLCLCATNEQGLEKLAMDCKKAGLDDKQVIHSLQLLKFSIRN